MKYVLDSNILVHAIRNSLLWNEIDRKFAPFNNGNFSYISIVTYAEIYSLAKQFNWGDAKINKIREVFSAIEILYLNKNLANIYVDIDVYSQGKHKEFQLPKDMSSRNMGKNDIWIAASTTKANAELITTDNDFDHLDKVFFKVNKIN